MHDNNKHYILYKCKIISIVIFLFQTSFRVRRLKTNTIHIRSQICTHSSPPLKISLSGSVSLSQYSSLTCPLFLTLFLFISLVFTLFFLFSFLVYLILTMFYIIYKCFTNFSNIQFFSQKSFK